MCAAAGSENSSGQPSDPDDGEEVAMDGIEGGKPSTVPGPAGELGEEPGSRLRTSRGGRGRGGLRGRGGRRRRNEAEDDDVSEATEDARVSSKRRKRGMLGTVLVAPNTF